MRIFYLAGYIESAGAGRAGMQQQMQDAGLLQPDIELNPQTQMFSIYQLHLSNPQASWTWLKQVND